MSEPLQHSHYRNTYLWKQRVVVARDKQRNSHGELNSNSAGVVRWIPSYRNFGCETFNTKIVFVSFSRRQFRAEAGAASANPIGEIKN
jgi:hypothetical protein